MGEVVQALPRTLAEVERMEGLTEVLSSNLQGLMTRLEVIEHHTSEQVLSLERLDLLKRNMETCARTLTEAANWSALVREVHASFASNALQQVADRLEAMHRSEDVLRSMPGALERRRTLTELAEQLETVLQPQLQEALQKERVVHSLTPVRRLQNKTPGRCTIHSPSIPWIL